MEKLTSEFRCENEFIVPLIRRGAAKTHAIAVFGDADLITDCIVDGDGNLLKEIRAAVAARQETEYNSVGKPVLTREILPGTWGTRTVHTITNTATKQESLSVETREGKLVSKKEKAYNLGGRLQSESESYFNPDGTPSVSMFNQLDSMGRVTRRDQVLWHNDSKPAITETTEFDANGCVSVYSKTVHNMSGDAMWEERMHFPNSSAKPSKKELTMFNSRHDKTFVEVVDYKADGTEAGHIVKMLAALTASTGASSAASTAASAAASTSASTAASVAASAAASAAASTAESAAASTAESTAASAAASTAESTSASTATSVAPNTTPASPAPAAAEPGEKAWVI